MGLHHQHQYEWQQPDSRRCKWGIHDWSVIPDEVLARAYKAGLQRQPTWYAGRTVPCRCLRCGQPK